MENCTRAFSRDLARVILTVGIVRSMTVDSFARLSESFEDENPESSALLSGFLLLDESGTLQQESLRIFLAHHTERPLPSQSDGRHRANNGLEIRVHHIRGKQLRNKGEDLYEKRSNSTLFSQRNTERISLHEKERSFANSYMPRLKAITIRL